MTSWDESKHPREPAGVPEGGQFIASAREGAGLPPEENPGARNNTFKGFWEWTKAKARTLGDEDEVLNFEQAWLVGPDGELLGEIGETRGKGMKFTGAEETRFPGNWLVHNHPGQASFSGPDIMYGFQESMAGMAVVEKNGLHLLSYNTESLFNVRATGVAEDPIFIGYELNDLWMSNMKRSLHRYHTEVNAGNFESATKALHRDTLWAVRDIADNSLYSNYLDFEYIPWGDL